MQRRSSAPCSSLMELVSWLYEYFLFAFRFQMGWLENIAIRHAFVAYSPLAHWCSAVMDYLLQPVEIYFASNVESSSLMLRGLTLSMKLMSMSSLFYAQGIHVSLLLVLMMAFMHDFISKVIGAKRPNSETNKLWVVNLETGSDSHWKTWVMLPLFFELSR